MKNELQLGVLTLVGEQGGGHIHVTVLGAGQPGSRALCGRITITVAEWSSLQVLVDVLALADKRHGEDRAEVDRLERSLRSENELGTERYVALTSATRQSDQLGEELERIVGGDGTSLERLRRLAKERDGARAEVDMSTRFVLAARQQRDRFANMLRELTERLALSRKFFAEQAQTTDAARRELSTVVVNALDRITEVAPAVVTVDDESRCAVCAWPLAESVKEGCVRGNCSARSGAYRFSGRGRSEKEAGRG